MKLKHNLVRKDYNGFGEKKCLDSDLNKDGGSVETQWKAMPVDVFDLAFLDHCFIFCAHLNWLILRVVDLASFSLI